MLFIVQGRQFAADFNIRICGVNKEACVWSSEVEPMTCVFVVCRGDLSVGISMKFRRIY